MILSHLFLENFAPFYRKHELALQVKPGAPVVVIHGENMRGKTSLLNAIRWCLYGNARGRGGRPKETHRLMNYDALREGENHMSVKLDFEHGGRNYELERHVQAPTRPRSDVDLEEKVYLRRSGHFLPEGQIDEEIGDILHPHISRFFLFDGEMLDQFEVLLFTPGRDSELVKGSIEQILGLPSLQIAVDDLDALHRVAERRQLRSVQQTKMNEAIVAKAQQAESDIEAFESDLKQLRLRCEEVESRRTSLSERRDAFADIQADVRALEQIEEAIDEHKVAVAKGIEECQALLGDAWWEPVGKYAAEMLDSAQARVQQMAESVQVAAEAGFHLKALRKAADGKCPICATNLSPDHKKELGEQLTQMERASTSGVSAAEMVGTQQIIGQLRQYISRERLRTFSEKERSIRKHQIDINRSDRAAEEIRQRIRGHNRLEVQRIETEYEETVAILSRLKDDIGSREAELSRRKDTLSALQQEIAKMPEAKPRIITEAAIYDSLRTVFSRSIDSFRERLRKDVEGEATRIFRSLTTESEYAGLAINDQYGLHIVDSQNLPIHDRSAGAEQIVALALIGALNHCATREGPVVMDTPFGRLDIKHRSNVLSFMPKLAPQVVLLVQSGEFDRERDMQYLAGAVSLEYRIVRDGRPTKSRIEGMV